MPETPDFDSQDRDEYFRQASNEWDDQFADGDSSSYYEDDWMEEDIVAGEPAQEFRENVINILYSKIMEIFERQETCVVVFSDTYVTLTRDDMEDGDVDDYVLLTLRHRPWRDLDDADVLPSAAGLREEEERDEEQLLDVLFHELSVADILSLEHLYTLGRKYAPRTSHHDLIRRLFQEWTKDDIRPSEEQMEHIFKPCLEAGEAWTIMRAAKDCLEYLGYSTAAIRQFYDHSERKRRGSLRTFAECTSIFPGTDKLTQQEDLEKALQTICADNRARILRHYLRSLPQQVPPEVIENVIRPLQTYEDEQVRKMVADILGRHDHE